MLSGLRQPPLNDVNEAQSLSFKSEFEFCRQPALVWVATGRKYDKVTVQNKINKSDKTQSWEDVGKKEHSISCPVNWFHVSQEPTGNENPTPFDPVIPLWVHALRK